MRKYKSGSRYAFWRWSECGHLTRLHLFKTPKHALMIHWIHAKDPYDDLHDHPVFLRTWVIRGGYMETVFGKGTRIWKRWSSHEIHPGYRHKLISVKPGTITLCWVFSESMDWYYFTTEGPIPWRDYQHQVKAEQDFDIHEAGKCEGPNLCHWCDSFDEDAGRPDR